MRCDPTDRQRMNSRKLKKKNLNCNKNRVAPTWPPNLPHSNTIDYIAKIFKRNQFRCGAPLDTCTKSSLAPTLSKDIFLPIRTLNSSGINTVNTFTSQTFNVFHIFKPSIIDIKVLKLQVQGFINEPP